VLEYVDDIEETKDNVP